MYISKIVAAEEMPSLQVEMLQDFDDYRIYVNKDGVENISDARTILNSRCFGFWNGADFYGVVSNTQKTIQLHRYVIKASTERGTGRIDFSDCDISILQAGGTVNNCGVVGKDSLAINTGLSQVSLHGILGSCACRRYRNDTRPELYNLYDILGLLCRRSQLNLMRYNRIFMYSRGWNSTTILELLHSVEANRYFTKMYMDVMRA